MTTVKNAKTLPKVYYGLHMVEGVAEYKKPGQKPYRIMIGEDAIKNMDPTFQGKPVYVRHVDEVDLENLQAEADGYVAESFFNKFDGKHWVKFIAVSDKAHEAIRNGWKLSNCYVPKSTKGGGLWHGVEFAKEVTQGEYEHLAIVNNPRYEESVILTPEQFKEYCGEKELELKRLANSKEEKTGVEGMLHLFKRQKIENSADLENTVVMLPKSKKEMTVVELATEMDKVLNMAGYANGDHMVKVGENEMTVNDLVKKHMDMCNEMAAAAEKEKGKDEKKENKEGEEKADEKKVEEKKENEEKEGEKKAEEKKENDDKDGDMDKKKNAHFESLKNAPTAALKNQATIDLSEDKVARGKVRYGSGV